MHRVCPQTIPADLLAALSGQPATAIPVADTVSVGPFAVYNAGAGYNFEVNCSDTPDRFSSGVVARR